ncbi:MAG: Ldh family oxidoreductase [Oscillospiraceae bacterium]|nr:Ldh family oxidoreductase [Oscillospiraceae bacterium]
MYDTQKLKVFCRRVMESAGLPEEQSIDFAESLVTADMRGIPSHGVTRLKAYHRRLADGVTDAAAKPAIAADLPSLLLIDGNNAMGVTTASFAMRECVSRAKTTGACFAAVRGGNHFGYAAYYSELAARAGMIGFSLCNASHAVAPFGGRTAELGTNPLAVTVPGRDTILLDLDMATSLVARGKVTLAAKKGQSIPSDWGIDEAGRPVTDPTAVSCVLPFGGYKGYGIGLVVEILASCISGAAGSQQMGSFYDFSRPQNVGFFLGALNVGGVTEFGAFADRVDALIRSLKSAPKAEGCDEILVAGEPEARRYREALVHGIELPAAVRAELEELSRVCGVPFDCELP